MGMFTNLVKIIFTTRYSERRARLQRQCIEMAEQQRDLSLTLSMRLDYVETIHHFHPEEAIAQFNRCLEIYEADPEKYKDQKGHLMWTYKWIVNSLHEFATIPLAAIQRAHSDMERRFAAWGYSSRAVNSIRVQAALAMGHTQDAARFVTQWQAAPRDDSADCEACEVNNHVWYLINSNEQDAALRVAEPLLAGRLRCESVPATTFSSFLLPTWKAGDRPRADHYQQRSIAVLRKLRSLTNLGEHLSYLSLTAQFGRAAKIAREFTPIASAHKSHNEQLEFFLGLRQYGLCLSKANVRTVPGALPGIAAQGAPTPDQVVEWTTQRCRSLATALDNRNGNTRLVDKMQAQSASLN